MVVITPVAEDFDIGYQIPNNVDVNKLVGSLCGLNSFDTFMFYVKFDPNDKSICDTSAILERPCYEMWIKTRKELPVNPQDCFRRTITAHVTGTKKRRPFEPVVEADLLQRLRMRRVWPCFEGRVGQNNKPILIGKSGFRAKGYHEQRNAVEPRVGQNEKPTTDSLAYGQASMKNTEHDFNEDHTSFSTPPVNPPVKQETYQPGQEAPPRQLFYDPQPEHVVHEVPQHYQSLGVEGKVNEGCSPYFEPPSQPMPLEPPMGEDEEFRFASFLLDCDIGEYFAEDSTPQSIPVEQIRDNSRKRGLGSSLIGWFIDVMDEGVGLDPQQDLYGPKSKVYRRRDSSVNDDTRGLTIIDHMISAAELDPAKRAKMEMCKLDWEHNIEDVKTLLRIFGVEPSEFVRPDEHGKEIPARDSDLSIMFSKSSTAKTMRAYLVKVVCFTVPRNTLKAILSAISKQVFEVCPEKVTQQLQVSVRGRDSDPRFSSDFRFLQKQFRLEADGLNGFDRNQPVGQAMYNPETGIYTWCDRVARQIMGGNLVGMSTVNIIRSMYSYWCCFNDTAPVIFLQGEVLFQVVTHTLQGKPIVIRTKHTLDERTNLIHTTFQQVDWLYPQLLDLPAIDM
mmetsp:Transcript_26107/g.42185  ORF Transcript_26107/g.42185 Transcript_26107/m.42185 type:complete len:617 (-) Transcript_26107:268-2118(-)|eukprot:CAMPEP_0203758040 /NCGR_PEP_ID=MMETSP0098-20131031/10818_1 /ASSEMBLY_ACC=CAM_ASM_000208 /TAXON_ID=96639 /ORGANISM=" , Strain NY0313808BC1" /LENGTH=616 /DNA_ID=CAMNT_0050650287 /DNA_START=585 /DNA_END=2435 /DNA_ORIENTATION=-